MAAASDIGANFSQYSGDPSLGGGTLGAVRIDTRPIEDLARYTMLYNREEYLQRQKEAEKAAEELAKFTQIDLSTTIPKDAKILQEKWEKAIEYARQNIGELTYSKNKEKWLEFNKLKADVVNDTKFAAIRSLLNVARKEEIAKETNEEIKKLMEKDLQDNINATDIRTPLDHAQKYDLSIPEFTKNAGIEVIPAKRAPNEIFRVKTKLFDVAEANRHGDAADIGFAFDPNSKTGKLKMLKSKENVWVQAKDIFNSAIQSAKNQDGSIDEKKLAGLKIMGNVDAYNKYIEQTKAEIASGVYNDKLGNGLKFGQGSLRIEDYEPINWQDGITAGELSKLYEYTQWAGDQREALDVIQTNELIEKQRLALGWANHYLEEDKFDELKKKSGSDFTKDIITADSVLSNMSNAIKSHKVVDVPDKSTKTGLKRYLEISDINLIEKYGKLGVNKDAQGHDGPQNDRLFLSQDENRFYLGHKDEDGKLVIGPQFSIEDWADNLTAGKMGASERGDVNTIISQVIRKYGNDALKLGYSYEGISPTIEKDGGKKTTESTQTIKKVKVKGL